MCSTVQISCLYNIFSLLTIIMAQIPENWESYIDADILKRTIGRSFGIGSATRLFQCDIEGISTYNDENDGNPAEGNVVDNAQYLWSNGKVPYSISEKFSPVENRRIKNAIDAISEQTSNCIIFIERKREIDHVQFIRGFWCSSRVGKQGGSQYITLAIGCMEHYGSIQHEVMHALGFHHEMSRADRDDHIFINWDNILTDQIKQFEKQHGKTFGIPYDYESVMQYPFNAFAKDKNLPTMIPKVKHARMGQNDNLSALDIVRIKEAYECASRGTTEQQRVPVKPPDATLSRIDVTKRTPLSTAVTTISTDHNHGIPETSSALSVFIASPEPFPTFLFRSVTLEECRSLNTGHCRSVAEKSWNCLGPNTIIHVNCDGTVDELVAVSSKIEHLNKSRPVQFSNYDWQTVAKVFAPIKMIVISLTITNCLNTATTSKLPGLNVPNIVHFGMNECSDMVVHKRDFAGNPKLRSLRFYRVTIDELEIETFTNLSELQRFSIEHGWARPFAAGFMAHLLRFHCDCDYAWFRRWLSDNPVLISPKKQGEVYHIGNFYNIALSRPVIFAPVDCSIQNLNDIDFDEKQINYSVNDFC